MALVRPAADLSKGGWTATSGSDLYAMLDETTRSDADYIISLAASPFSYLVADTFGASPETGTRILGTGVTVANGRASLPGNTSWKGVGYGTFTRGNGLAFLARLIYGDIQAGTALSGGVATPSSAVGFFSNPAPTNPGAAVGSIASFNASSQAGGFSVSGAVIIPSAKQITFDHIAMLRDRGSIHFIAANPTARNVGSRPLMRPIYIEQANTTSALYVAVHARDAGAAVEQFAARVLEEYPNWYGPATIADALTTTSGTTALAGTAAEVGGTWTSAGSYVKTTTGAQRGGSGGAHVTAPDNDHGILAVEFTIGTTYGQELQFFRTNGSNYVCLWILNATTVQIVNIVSGAVQSTVASYAVGSMATSTQRFVLVFQGRSVRTYKNGVDITNNTPATIPATNTGLLVGFSVPSTTDRVTRFERQPATVAIPTSLILEAPWAPRLITATPITEDFAGSGTMEGKTSTTGGVTWTRTTGTATITRDGAGAAAASSTPGADTYYSAPFTGTYADLYLNRRGGASGSTMANVASFATVMATDGSNILACRPFLHSSQPGTTEFEILYGPSGSTPIVMRVAMALELTPGGTQAFRFVVDTASGMCSVLLNGEPVAEYRHGLTTLTRIGWGLGVNDVGTLLYDFSVST